MLANSPSNKMSTSTCPTAPVAVLGAGSWGTALAALACQRRPTLLWARDASRVAYINRHHQLPDHLPNMTLPAALEASADFSAAMAHVLADDTQPGLLILGVPLNGIAELCARISAHLPAQRRQPLYVLRTSKGIDPDSLQLPHQLTDEHLTPRPWLHTGTLSGPSFALEVAQGLPVALTVASADPDLAACVVETLHGKSARIYRSTDIMGVEIGGALKNIIAIACGVSDGLALGANARAALITRGLAEIQRLGTALGGQATTFAGLTGLGDLVLTTTGDLSRNRQVGLAIAQGQSLSSLLASGITAEGVRCAQAAQRLAQAHGVDVPLIDAVCDVLFTELPPIEAARLLMGRMPRLEG